jgi:hypothetical protein
MYYQPRVYSVDDNPMLRVCWHLSMFLCPVASRIQQTKPFPPHFPFSQNGTSFLALFIVSLPVLHVCVKCTSVLALFSVSLLVLHVCVKCTSVLALFSVSLPVLYVCDSFTLCAKSMVCLCNCFNSQCLCPTSRVFHRTVRLKLLISYALPCLVSCVSCLVICLTNSLPLASSHCFISPPTHSTHLSYWHLAGALIVPQQLWASTTKMPPPIPSMTSSVPVFSNSNPPL